jgi:hypothetical protein
MQLLCFARPAPLIRSVLLALALMLGANAVAHAEHDHAAQTATHTAACGYCVTFGGLADSPAHAPLVFTQPAAPALRAASIVSFIGHSARTHTQPRAPPVLPSLN